MWGKSPNIGIRLIFDCKRQKPQNINDLNKMGVYISVTKTESRNGKTTIQVTGQGSRGHISLLVDKTRLIFLPTFAPSPPFTFIDR